MKWALLLLIPLITAINLRHDDASLITEVDNLSKELNRL